MNDFATDVEVGLSEVPKRLPSKYFYDDRGSRLFQRIMALPEYYLTDCEHEILDLQAAEIVTAAGFPGHFNVVELGAGDGAKTERLLAHLVELGIDFSYVPIDISGEALEILHASLKGRYPGMEVLPVLGDYFKVLDQVVRGGDPNLLLFLGSNLGNYNSAAATSLLELMRSRMRLEDRLLVGLDLQKSPLVINAAYNDDEGVTREFNLNLLTRINRELGGTFDRERFDFYSCYNPVQGEVRSFLVSSEEQEVKIASLGRDFAFGRGEWIHTELSSKYSLPQIESMAATTGFEVLQNFYDQRHYFADSLWRPVAT